MKKACIYCSGLDNQYKECLEYAQSNGFEVTGSSKDISSGVNFHRSGLNKILSAAKQGKIDAVITEDISRIGCDLKTLLEYMDGLKPYSTKIFIPNQGEVNPALSEVTEIFKDECKKRENE